MCVLLPADEGVVEAVRSEITCIINQLGLGWVSSLFVFVLDRMDVLITSGLITACAAKPPVDPVTPD